MVHEIIGVIEKSLVITTFVISMMLFIEFVNVVTRGLWQKKLKNFVFSQYLLGGLLGVSPGCLGAFAVVSMYTHHMIRIGAVITAMIATSGDETWIMLKLFPGKTFVLMGILLVTGIVAGLIIDLLFKNTKFFNKTKCCKGGFKYHEHKTEFKISFFQIKKNFNKISPIRGILLIVFSILLFLIVAGKIGHGDAFEKITFIFILTISIFIISVVSDHFLEDHLWNHLFVKHVPRIFGWMVVALLFLTMVKHFDLQAYIKGSPYVVLFISALVGILPQSEPHLIFVNMFVAGFVPFSVLITSSIVQDGHGSLPLLAYSTKDFLFVKIVNVIVGLMVGYSFLFLGF
jgi:Putative, 10TM heavy-metal exporter